MKVWLVYEPNGEPPEYVFEDQALAQLDLEAERENLRASGNEAWDTLRVVGVEVVKAKDAPETPTASPELEPDREQVLRQRLDVAYRLLGERMVTAEQHRHSH